MSRVAVYRTDRELRSYRRKIRRQREIRRNIILVLASVIFVLIFAITFHSFTSFANTDTENVSYKYFDSIQVEKGDTLWSLAEKYADADHYNTNSEYISEVMRINHLHDDEIIAGQYLVIPYYSNEFVQ